jgi:hypothetical protein
MQNRAFEAVVQSVSLCLPTGLRREPRRLPGLGGTGYLPCSAAKSMAVGRIELIVVVARSRQAEWWKL